MPKPGSASVGPQTHGRRLALILLCAIVQLSGIVGAPTPAWASPGWSPNELVPLAGDASYDPDPAIPADPAPIDVPDEIGGATVSGVADDRIALRPEPPDVVQPAVRTELADQRTEKGRVYANPDGTRTLELSQTRVNFRDPAGLWQPIDLALVEDAAGLYALRVAANDRTVRLAQLEAEVALAELSADGLSIGLRALGYGAGTRATEQLTFNGGPAKGDLSVRPTEAGFEFFVTLDRPDQQTTYHFALDTRGLTAQLGADGKTVLLFAPIPHGAVAASDPTVGALVGAISAPLMLEGGRQEGNGNPVSVILTRPGETNLEPGVPLAAVAGLSPDEILLTYRIDPDWLADRARKFPVILDPTACIGNVAAGCDINLTSGSFDEFIFNQNPDSHTSGWTVFRTGFDNRTECCPAGEYATMRGLLYFPDVTLGDGAQVTQATVRLTADGEWGAEGQQLQFFRITTAWATNLVTWNNMVNGWDSNSGSLPTTIPAGTGPGTQVPFDVTNIVRSLYTRRGPDWKPNIGLLLKFQNEGVSYGEVAWRKGDAPVGVDRPLLMISYVVPRPEFGFAPALGSTYAPSAMLAGQTTRLPITV